MNNQKLFQEFENHLKNICEDQEYYGWAIEFFNFLAQINFEISSEHFDKLHLSSNDKFNLDLENDLFKENTKISIAELFVYNFKNFVKSCQALNKNEYNKLSNNDGTTGLYSHKDLAIFCNKDYDAINAYTIHFRNANQNSNQKDLNNWYRKKTFWHELSHLMQIKTYNRNIFGMGLDEQLVEYDPFNRKKESFIHSCGHIKTEFIRKMILDGSYLLTEIFNEYAVNSITNTLCVIPAEPRTQPSHIPYSRNCFAIINGNFIQENSVYLENMFIAPMLAMIFGDKFSPYDITFKTHFYDMKLGQIPLDDDFDEQLCKKMAKILREYRNIPEENTLQALKKMPMFKVLKFIIGTRDKCTSRCLVATSELQALLIHLYKNKLISEFNNSDVLKNEQYFKNLNQNLETIAKFIHLPWKQKINVTNIKNNHTSIQTIQDCPVFKHLQTLYPNTLNIQEFNKLINAIEHYMQAFKIQSPYLKDLTFIQNQKLLAKQYNITHIAQEK